MSKAAARNKALIENDAEEFVSTELTTQNFSLPTNVKLKRVVTMPSLVIKTVGEAHTLLFMTSIRKSTVVIKGKEDEKPANIANVRDMTNGREFIFLVPTVVQKNLEQEYPDDSFVGKMFYIQHLGKRKEGQRYVDFGIAEVESEAAE